MGRSDGGCKHKEDSLDGRLTRRLLGLLRSRLPETRLEWMTDTRRQASIRWALPTVLQAVVVSMLAGCKSLAEMEALTDEMSLAARRLLGIPRRLPDTTARQVLLGVEPEELRNVIRLQVLAAHRRKALQPEGLPFGVVAMDGKFVPAPGDRRSPFVQACRRQDGSSYGRIGTLTATLISSRAKVCLDAEPIRASWGESTRYPHLLGDLLDAYGSRDLFRLVTYDAAACSRANARDTREMGLDYLFRVKQGSQPKLYAEMVHRLAHQPLDQAATVVAERYRGLVVRRSVYLAEDLGIWPAWAQDRTAVRIRCDRLDDHGEVVDSEDRYYITSLSADELTPEQWSRVTRGHWGVENNCHHTWDAVMREDDRRWIEADPRASLVVMMLRRVAYNLATLYRSVTLRSAPTQLTPWRTLLRWIHNALIAATERHTEGLRQRKLPDPALA